MTSIAGFISRFPCVLTARFPVTALALTAAFALPIHASAACLHGINLAGAEFGAIGGSVGSEYSYPTQKTIDYFAEAGMNAVRLPFRWERLQPVLNGPLAPSELARLTATVKSIRGKGMTVILDVHNYARFNDSVIGSNSVPVPAFADFWAKLAGQFANQPGIIFGLMNEPHDIKVKSWLTSANATTAAIRAVGAKNMILVPGTSWTGAHSWKASTGDGNNGKTMLGFVDPANNYAYEVHQYFDQDYSGTSASCHGASGALAGLQSFTNWLKINGKRGFLGEFGTGNSDECVSALKKAVDIVNADPSVWAGWTYWAAGDRWPANYILSVQPSGDRVRSQMAALTGSDAQETASCPALSGN